MFAGTFVYWEVTAVSTTDSHTCNSTDPGIIEMSIPNVSILLSTYV